jgi:hypothetical protein
VSEIDRNQCIFFTSGHGLRSPFSPSAGGSAFSAGGCTPAQVKFTYGHFTTTTHSDLSLQAWELVFVMKLHAGVCGIAFQLDSERIDVPAMCRQLFVQ